MPTKKKKNPIIYGKGAIESPSKYQFWYTVTNGNISLFLAEYIPLCVCVCLSVLIYSIYSSFDGHLGGFLILVIINNATINVEAYVCFCISGFVVFR